MGWGQPSFLSRRDLLCFLFFYVILRFFVCFCSETNLLIEVEMEIT